MRPLVSVIMPTYNCGIYIADTINSVINQTIDDWEIQIVDDCSTDNTKELLAPFIKQYPQIKYSCLSQRSGPAVARTEAIKKARGKYCAFLDSDDLWLPNKIEKQILYMQKNDIDFCCSSYQRMNENGVILPIRYVPPHKISYKKCIQLSNPIGNLTAAYNQERLGKFEVPNIKKRNDFALWLQILKKTPYCFGMEDVLAIYRTGRSESVSHNKLKQIKYHWMLYHEIEKHCLFRSLYEMGCWAFVKGTKVGIKRISLSAQDCAK